MPPEGGPLDPELGKKLVRDGKAAIVNGTYYRRWNGMTLFFLNIFLFVPKLLRQAGVSGSRPIPIGHQSRKSAPRSNVGSPNAAGCTRTF